MTTESQLAELPPLPSPIFDYTEQDKHIEFKSDSPPENIKHKLWLMWCLYGNLIGNEELAQLVEKHLKASTRKNKLASAVITILDQMGKILSQGALLDEINWLTNNEISPLTGGDSDSAPCSIVPEISPNTEQGLDNSAPDS